MIVISGRGGSKLVSVESQRIKKNSRRARRTREFVEDRKTLGAFLSPPPEP